MELKRYQERALERLSTWFEHLLSHTASPAHAWESMGSEMPLPPFRERRVAELSKPIPHVCLKVPTGGGKTLLGVEALARYRMRTGLVLWMVPSRAIYEQTRKALWTRQHPYRVALDRGCGGRAKMMEKSYNLQRYDIENHLCFMLISLQSARRRNNKEFLKMFQESGYYSTFFPDQDDEAGMDLLRERDLRLDLDGSRILRTQANVFKICEPVIVLDEAHKAYGTNNQDELWDSWVNQFNPQLVLELSATPDETKSNILVDVGGTDLKEEEMIKLPIHVTGHGATRSWQDVLRSAESQLEELSDAATRMPDDRRIRPMAVVRVPRTGKDQRKGGHLHAEDVREFLVCTLGFSDDEVRVQSGETKELDGEDLMSDECRVRWIITKDALKEGWDCSFAYILVLLDNTRAQITVTQMMGRVLRQPYARLTGIPALDRCYVHCSDVGVDKAVDFVRRELERDGFGDLEGQVFGVEREAEPPLTINRRPKIDRNLARLPQVLRGDGSDFDYELDILASVEWEKVDVPSGWDDLYASVGGQSAMLDFDGDTFSRALPQDEVLPSGDEQDRTDERRGVGGHDEFDLEWHVRQLREAVPNPWQAARLALEARDQVHSEGFDDQWMRPRRAAFVSRIVHHVNEQVDRLAEQIFERKLKAGAIKFDMDMPFEFEDCYEVHIPVKGQFPLDVKRSLFSPYYGHDLNRIERLYAIYLDKEDAIRWWHRVAARVPGEYKLQGWRKDSVYPDFVALRVNDVIVVHETKGGHLQGNDDTLYKQRLLACLQQHFNDSGIISLHGTAMSGDFRIVFENEIHAMHA